MSKTILKNKIYKGKLFFLTLVVHFSFFVYSFTFIAEPELITKQALGGKVQINLPVGFTVMEQEAVQKKYPQRAGRPLEVYTNADGSITVGLDHMDNKSSFEELPAYKKAFEAQFSKINGIEFRRNEIKKVNGRDFILLEMITPIPDSKIYNLMYITSFEGRLLLTTFNCTEEYLEDWKSTALQIMNSIKVQ